jgi:hypothetical protein
MRRPGRYAPLLTIVLATAVPAAAAGPVNHAADFRKDPAYTQLVLSDDFVLASGLVLDASCFAGADPAGRERNLVWLESLEREAREAAACRRFGIDETRRVERALRHSTLTCGTVEREIKHAGAKRKVRVPSPGLGIAEARVVIDPVVAGEDQKEFTDQIVLNLDLNAGARPAPRELAGTLLHELLHAGRMQIDIWHVDLDEVINGNRNMSGCSNSFYEDPVYFVTDVCAADSKDARDFWKKNLGRCVDLCHAALGKIVKDDQAGASVWALKNPGRPRQYDGMTIDRICAKINE